MKPVVFRFALTAVAFVAWIGYLFYLYQHLPASPNGLPAILSRPQFLVSDLDVVGAIEDQDRTLSLAELLGGGAGADALGHSVSAAAGLGGAVALREPALAVRVVKVRDVLYSGDGSVKPGRSIGVTNFADCRSPRPGLELPAELPPQLSQLGDCLLPLRSRDRGVTWEVVPLPPSPGFSPVRDVPPAQSVRLDAPRIYPANAETLAQYRQLGKTP